VVKVRAFIVMAALAGCGEPTPLFCLDDSTCSGGVCIDKFCAQSDLACLSGYRYHESAGEKAGECTGEGNGGGGSGSSDGGTGVADPVQTLPPGEGGATVNASEANDDIRPPCATNPTGRDVMFEITVVSGLTRLYVDTFLTSFDVVLAVYEGACASISSATNPLGCVNATSADACDTRTMMWSQNVRPGTHCIVVDQAGMGAAAAIHVRAIHGPPAITASVGVTSGTTCGHDAFDPGNLCTVPNGPDETWFFKACSGTYNAATPVGWPGEIEARTETVKYDCDLGESGADFTFTKPGPVWLIAHQSAGACGALSLDIL
jgi:hypothetical protein